MRVRLIILLQFCFLMAVSPSMAARIMITAFDPFGGADVNRSQDTAKQLQSQLAKDGVTVDICIIPVVYDVAAQKAQECYNNLNPKPDMVLSLGEGGCSLQMETAAHNRDSSAGYPDNAGTIRTNKKIDESKPKSVAFRSFVTEMYCALSESERERISISESPGGFVCNNTAYHLGNFFENLKIPYTFIHVPNNRCAPGATLAKEAGNDIAKMIKNLPLIRAPKDKTSLCQYPLLPTTYEQASAILELLSSNKKDSTVRCEKQFNEVLSRRLLLWQNKDTTY